jgi:nitrogen fixation/metabolism regulation signal transduction histidine kinase
MTDRHPAALEAPRTVTASGRGRRLLFTVLLGIGAFAAMASLALLTASAQDAHFIKELQPLLLAFNVLAACVLISLISRKLYVLIKDYRQQVPGSRMNARAVRMFSLLALAPILVVYLFSVNAINRGIDSWFDVNIGTGLDNALALSRAALSLRTREFGANTKALAADLAETSNVELVTTLDRYRRVAGASELTVIGDHSRIIAASTDFSTGSIPKLPAREVLLQARQGQVYLSLDPVQGGGYRVLTALTAGNDSSGEPRILVASYSVPEQLGTLADGVQTAYAQYGQRTYQRPYLKSIFVLTLTIVLLLSALGAVYGAFYWAARLAKPVQDLIEGTRAVGAGDLDRTLERASDDEMGFLVHSFNNMTQRLARARSDAEDSRSAVDQERARLAVILARISTGVISIDRDFTLRTANAAASHILGVNLDPSVGLSLTALASDKSLVAQFIVACQQQVDVGPADWRAPVQLGTDSGRRELMVACTELPATEGSVAGLVIVFDDITELLKAQRDAAWGEVARRLAHEIKNPLTPIQLSADRMRRRLTGQLNPHDAEILESATSTIVHQVEAMRQMVNAFSEYAKAPAMDVTAFDFNQLVREVADLYRAQGLTADASHVIQVGLKLDERIGMLVADRGRVRQILNNLLTNAFEAVDGRDGAAIAIETHLVITDEHPVAELIVRDNGLGFPAGLLGQAFDPYVTSKAKGTGLGLAIVKKIVEEHGGRIDADNVTTGGARVRVWLPCPELVRSQGALSSVRDARTTERRREQI